MDFNSQVSAGNYLTFIKHSLVTKDFWWNNELLSGSFPVFDTGIHVNLLTARGIHALTELQLISGISN